MNARHVQALIEVSSSIDRGKTWEPEGAVLCPRKQGLLANDRCLELQAQDRCTCPNAATRSLRQAAAADRAGELRRRRLLAEGRAPRNTASVAGHRILIGLHGKLQHGKTTIARHLIDRHGFVRIRFAGPLKEVLCAQLFRMTEAQADGWLKESPCVDVTGMEPWALARDAVALLPPAGTRSYGYSGADLLARWEAVFAPLFAGAARLYSPREIMTTVGGGARTHISPSVWIDLWRDSLERSDAARIVVDDVRYPNEKAAIEAAGGEVWRSVRTDLPVPAVEDTSETACDHLPDEVFGAVLRRKTGVPELLTQVDQLLEARLARVLPEAS